MSSGPAISGSTVVVRTSGSSVPHAPVPKDSPALSAQATNSEPAKNDDVSSPRRKRWAATLLTPAILLVAVVGGHWVWTWQAERRLNRFIDELRRNGEPVSVTDFIAAAPVPEADNAAITLRDAGNSVSYDTEIWQAFLSLSPVSYPLGASDLGVIRATLNANKDALTGVRTAMNKRSLEWAGLRSAASGSPRRFGFGGGTGRGMGPFRQRGLSQMLYASVLVAHQDGDDRLAMQTVEQLLFLSRATARRPTMLAQAGSIRLCEFALVALAQILPDLAIGDGERSVSKAQIKSLIERLLDETDSREGIVRSLQAERARHIDSLLSKGTPQIVLTNEGVPLDLGPWGEPLSMPSPGSTISRYVSRPVYVAQAQVALERLNRAVSSFASPDLRSFTASFRQNPGSSPGDEPATSGAGETDTDGENDHTRLIDSTIDSLGQMHYLSLAERRTTALALAITLYKSDHGAWPTADLKPLVPAYLPRMPIDPLSMAAEPINYVADAKRPRVYTVGEDGIDDGGWPPEPYVNRPEDLRMTDWVIDLVRQPLRAASDSKG